MRAEIEDLEAFKELGDEMEENHVETEKALQEEIGTSNDFFIFPSYATNTISCTDEKDMQILAQLRAIDVLQDSIEDYDITIGQFRELVGNLQRYDPQPLQNDRSLA